MADQKDTRDMRISMSHSQYVLYAANAEPLELTADDLAGGNGLVSVTPASTYASIMTGTSWGNVDLTIEVTKEEPALHVDDWDEIVDISLHVPSTALNIGDVSADSTEEIPLPTGNEPRWWRVRVHARGRDAAAEAGDIWAEEGDEVLEQHLLYLWPAPPAPELRHKLTDEVGADVRDPQTDPHASGKAEKAHIAPPKHEQPHSLPHHTRTTNLHTRDS
ncbi:hypothetical protein [Streptomyces youssoufiensis]